MLQINAVHQGSEKSLNVKAAWHLVAKMYIIRDIYRQSRLAAQQTTNTEHRDKDKTGKVHSTIHIENRERKVLMLCDPTNSDER